MRQKNGTRQARSLQKRLLVYMILIALIPALCLLCGYFHYVRQQTLDQLKHDSEQQLAAALEKLDLVAEQVNDFVMWTSCSEPLQALLQRTEQVSVYDGGLCPCRAVAAGHAAGGGRTAKRCV